MMPFGPVLPQDGSAVRPLASKPDNQRPFPGSAWWEEKTDSNKLSSYLSVCTMACSHAPYAHPHTSNTMFIQSDEIFGFLAFTSM